MRIVTSLILLLATLSTSIRAQSQQPNIIFILCDDLGYGDMGTFFQNLRATENDRSEPFHVTPHLDALASSGLRLPHHYCPAPVCAPSRASLLTGVSQGHAVRRNNDFDQLLENNHTLATVLKQAGYSTAAIGKWGLQGCGNNATTWASYPTKRGFDFFHGYIRHGDGHEHYPKEGKYRGSKEVWENNTEISIQLDKCYTTDLFTARAKKWIIDEKTATPAKPLFLYLAYDTPHAVTEIPTVAYPSGGGTTGGLQWTGTSGAIINTATGTIDSYYHPDYANATWDHDNNPSTAEEAWPDVYKRYATSVRRIDNCVKDIQQTLTDLGIADDTLIVFTTDNGPSNESYLPQGLKANFFNSFGPFDGIKRDCLEGGIRVGAIANWPNGIPAGRTSDIPSQFQDWLPTFAELAGIPSPARSDGTSLVPTLKNTGIQKTPQVYVEYQNNSSTPDYSEFGPNNGGKTRNQMQMIRIGDHVGVRYNISSHATPFEIYDIVNDPSERTNLASTMPELQQEMLDSVLRIRRPSNAHGRPYDTAQIPPVTPASTTTGLSYATFEGDYPWLPNLSQLTPVTIGHTSTTDLTVRTREDNIGISYTGYLDVPIAGTYNFHLASDNSTSLWIHDSNIIENDFNHTTSISSGNVYLQAGLHPIRLYYRHTTASTHTLNLEWEGPSITRQPIPASAFKRDFVLPPGPPQAQNDGPIQIPENTSTLIDVLSNDIDDGTPAPLTITSVTAPTNGTTTIENNHIRYTPNNNYNGNDSFTYTISDSEGTDTATVTLEITPNAPPSASPDAILTPKNTSATLTPLDNDTDPDGPNALEITSISSPTNGTATLNNNNIQYTPQTNFTGVDSFTYQVTDGITTTTGNINVTVAHTPDFLWIPFDQSNTLTVQDIAGQQLGNLSGYPTGNQPWITGKHFNAINLDGNTQQLIIPKAIYSPPYGNSPRTIMAWLKPAASQSETPTWLGYGNNDSGQRLSARVEVAGSNIYPRIEVQSDYRIGSTNLNDGQWHHIAIVIQDANNDGNIKLTECPIYIDGQIETISDEGNGTPNVDTSNVNDLIIGGSPHNEGYNYGGGIDDLRIYPYAMDADAIAVIGNRSALADAWFQQQVGNPSPTSSDWNLDVDNDGLNAYLEFALGGSTNQPDANLLPTIKISPTGGLELSHNIRDGLSASEYEIYTSQTLLTQSWTIFTPTETSTSPTDTFGFQKRTLPIPTDPMTPLQFFQLRLTTPE